MKEFVDTWGLSFEFALQWTTWWTRHWKSWKTELWIPKPTNSNFVWIEILRILYFIHSQNIRTIGDEMTRQKAYSIISRHGNMFGFVCSPVPFATLEVGLCAVTVTAVTESHPDIEP
jgi:hypothetical protein